MDQWHSKQESQKMGKYDQACRRRGWDFVPFVMDVWGGFGDEAYKLMGTLNKAYLGQFEGWQRREREAAVWQSLSLSLARELGRQLVWGVHTATEPSLPPSQHQPYF